MSYSFDGDFVVATSREDAFEVLSDAARFAPMLPTYVSHTVRDDGAAVVKVKVGVGKVRGTGEVILTREECDPPKRATYSGKGKVMGGAFDLNAGFELEEKASAETLVNWTGEMTMYGKLVSLAGGMVKPVAQRDIKRLIDALQAQMGGAEPEVPVAKPPPRPGAFARFWNWLKGLFRSGSPDNTKGEE